MDFNHKYAHNIAKDYIGTTESLTRLGWGIGGYVYLPISEARSKSIAVPTGTVQRLKHIGCFRNFNCSNFTD